MRFMHKEELPFSLSDTVWVVGKSVRQFGGFNQCAVLTEQIQGGSRLAILRTVSLQTFAFDPDKVAALITHHPLQPYPDGYNLLDQFPSDTSARNIFDNPEKQRRIDHISFSDPPLDRYQPSFFPCQMEL